MSNCIFKNEIPATKEGLLTAERDSKEFSNIFVNESGALKVQEIIGGTEVLADNTEDAKKLLLERGQYRYKGKMGFQEPIEEKGIVVEDKVVRIAEDDEFKRMYIHKLNIVPTGEKDDAGNHIANVTAVFTMVDNPVWLVPALWAVTAVGGTVGGWFLVDRVEEFTSTTSGSLITIGATVIGAWLTWKALSS